MEPRPNTALIDRALWVVAGLGLAGASAFLVARGLARTLSGAFSDFKIFFTAAEAMVRGEDLYSSGTNEYIYPPLIAWMISPLTGLGYGGAMRAWFAFNVILTAVSVWVLFRETCRRFEVKPEPLLLAWVTLLTILANFGAVRWEFEFGQCDTLVLLGFALGLRWMDTRPVLAGAALGLAFAVKYQTLLALVYLLARRRFVAAAACVASIAFFLFLPAITFGWDETVRSVQVAFAGMLNHVGLGPGADITRAANLIPASYSRSVSITSVAARLTGDGHPARMVALTGAVGLALLALGWWLYRRCGESLIAGRGAPADLQRERHATVAIEWAGLIVVALAFSPHTLARHTFIMIPVHIIAFTILLRPRSGVSPWPLLIGAALYSAGVMLPPGGEQTPALRWWRGVGGTTWCMLVFYFALVWTALRYARAGPAAEVPVIGAKA